MIKGINKHIISFEILDTTNPKTLVLLDTSDYYQNPERPLLEVTMPGYNKYFLANITARQVNTLNSNTLGLTEILPLRDLVELPDGIWTFKLKVCPYDKVYKINYHLRTVNLENSLACIYENLDVTDCEIASSEKVKKDIIDISIAIEAGKANAKKGNIKKAHDLYQIANKLIRKVQNKFQK